MAVDLAERARAGMCRWQPCCEASLLPGHQGPAFQRSSSINFTPLRYEGRYHLFLHLNILIIVLNLYFVESIFVTFIIDAGCVFRWHTQLITLTAGSLALRNYYYPYHVH